MLYKILALTLAYYVVLVSGECKGGCNQPTLLYDDIRCKPVYDKPDDCCPAKYDCSHLENRPKDKCHLKGQFYSPSTEIDSDLIYGNCHVACRCNDRTEYTCAVLDCPEWLGHYPSPGCYLQYELNKCCGMKEVCPPFDKLPTCKVGDKVYKEGERFSAPDQKCVSCVCREGFQGKFEEPFCRRQNCTVEIRHSDDIRRNCAPAYSKLTDCCPWEWICPESAEDKIVKAASPKRADLQCKFGTKLLNVGDKFERVKIMSEYERFETKCECVLPPLLTCTKVQIFDKDKAPEHIRPFL